MPSLRNDYVVLCDSCYKPIEGKSVMVNGKKPWTLGYITNLQKTAPTQLKQLKSGGG
jgi:hypothetical protein